jgi:histidyl-tRNA synthetase
MKLAAPRGTKDILPPESSLWKEIENAVDETARLMGFGEIRTPSFENVNLFKRSVGEETDIVSKEMYVFADKGGEEMALRPELTASVVRAAIEHNLLSQQGSLCKFYYNSAPMFRYERPQMGRQRQFHQFGVEILGSAEPIADLQTIAFALGVYSKLGIGNFRVRLNTLGSPSSRSRWKESLVSYLQNYQNELSEESRRRLQTNPLRVLDSKNESDRRIVSGAPRITEFLDEADTAHFSEVRSHLDTAGIAFDLDHTLVRGLDYYSRTVFEITSSDLGSQDALCGGGRYDGLVGLLGGPTTPAVGFAAGVERLVIVLQKLRGEIKAVPADYYLVVQSKEALHMLIEIVSELNSRGISVVYDLQNRSMKAQMREAGKMGVPQVLILGADELAASEITVKNMSTGTEMRQPIRQLYEQYPKLS